MAIVHNCDLYPFLLYLSPVAQSLLDYIEDKGYRVEMHINPVPFDFYYTEEQMAEISWPLPSWCSAHNEHRSNKPYIQDRLQVVSLKGKISTSKVDLPANFKVSKGGRPQAIIQPLTTKPIYSEKSVPYRYFPRPGFLEAYKLLKQMDPKIRMEDLAKLGSKKGHYNESLVEGRTVLDMENVTQPCFGHSFTILQGGLEYYALEVACLERDLAMNIEAIKDFLAEVAPLLLK